MSELNQTPKNSKGQQSPLVSVIIPAFNVAVFIVQSVNSALKQTFSDIEVIVVDDGSTDGTGKAVENISDRRLRIIKKLNGGCASARNAGLRAAEGKFISFLDGDDFWLVDKLERELAFFEKHPDADLVFSLSRIVDEAGHNLGLLNPVPHRAYSFEDLLIENPVANGSAAIFRRQALELAGPFDESLAASSDYDMWLRIVRLRPDNFICLPEILTCYRRRSKQTTGNWRRMSFAYERVLEKARIVDAEAVDRLEHRSRSNKYRYLAYIAWESGELGKSAWFLRKSMRSSRRTFMLDPRSWLMGLALTSKAILPERINDALFRYFLLAREIIFKSRRRVQHWSE